MNEMTVFILFSFNYLFTEYVALQEQRCTIGWGFLGLLFLNLGVNWIIMVVFSVMSIVMKVKDDNLMMKINFMIKVKM